MIIIILVNMLREIHVDHILLTDNCVCVEGGGGWGVGVGGGGGGGVYRLTSRQLISGVFYSFYFNR